MRPAYDTFLHDAASLLLTAETAAGNTDYTLLIQDDGSLHVVAESDWPLETLAAHHGARRAYRVTHNGWQVSVEGRAGSRRCTVESEPPAAIARRLTGAPGLYRLTAAAETG